MMKRDKFSCPILGGGFDGDENIFSKGIFWLDMR
jgi:hypothetical protein